MGMRTEPMKVEFVSAKEEPYEIDGKSGTYFSVWVTLDGEPTRFSAVKDFDRSSLPVMGTACEIVVEFQQFNRQWRPKIESIKALAASKA